MLGFKRKKIFSLPELFYFNNLRLFLSKKCPYYATPIQSIKPVFRMADIYRVEECFLQGTGFYLIGCELTLASALILIGQW